MVKQNNVLYLAFSLLSLLVLVAVANIGGRWLICGGGRWLWAVAVDLRYGLLLLLLLLLLMIMGEGTIYYFNV